MNNPLAKFHNKCAGKCRKLCMVFVFPYYVTASRAVNSTRDLIPDRMIPLSIGFP